MKSIYFPKAGNLILVKYGSTGTLTYDTTNAVLNQGTVVSIAGNISVNSTDLADGNSDWPLTSVETGRTGQFTVTMSSFQPAVYAALTGSTVTDVESPSSMWKVEEEMTVPSSSPYTVTLEKSYNGTGTFVMVDSSGSPMTKGSPAALGTCYVSQNVATFHSADAGKGMVATYEWTSTGATKVAVASSGTRPMLQAIIDGYAASEDDINIYDTNIVIDKCKATGDINLPTAQREPQTWNFTLKVLKPRGGYNPVLFKYSKRP